MTTSRSIYDYAKSIKIPVYFFKPIKLDLDIKNPLNCIRYLFELYKFKKRVQSFFNKYEGGKLFHNVESVDICFLYLLKKCKENNKLRSFKFKDQNDSNKTLKISLKNIYFIGYAWIFSKIYKLDLKARIINGEPLIHNTRDYSEISFNESLNVQSSTSHTGELAATKNEITTFLPLNSSNDLNFRSPSTNSNFGA